MQGITLSSKAHSIFNYLLYFFIYIMGPIPPLADPGMGLACQNFSQGDIFNWFRVSKGSHPAKISASVSDT